MLAKFQSLFQDGRGLGSPATLSKNDRDELRNVNKQVAAAEQQRDSNAKAWFNHLLSDQLIFRRATGMVVDKETYLKGLDGANPFTLREAQEIKIMGLENGWALVILVVRTRKADKSEKRFRNIRLFSK